MADSKATYQEDSSVKDCEPANGMLPNNIRNGLHNGIGKKVEEKEDIPNYGNAIVTQEKNKLLETTTELQEIIINILQQKLKLSYIRNNHFMNGVYNAVENVQKATDESVKKFLDDSGKDISEFKVIMEFLGSIKIEQEEDFVVNTEKFLEECRRMFMKYEETYKKCKILLSDFLKNVEKILKINKLPKNCELQERVLFSVFEEKLSSYNRILALSERAFNEFEVLLKHDVKNPEQDINKTTNFLLTILNMVEFAFGKLKLLAIEVLKIDFAKV